jgi:hypothetical protein
VAQASLPPLCSSERMLKGQVRARLARAGQEVAGWMSLLPAPEEAPWEGSGGTVIQLRKSLWEHIVKVAHDLGQTAPRQVRVVPRFDDVGVRTSNGISELLVSPVMLSTREGEARFLIARALFRHASGLDELERRGQPMSRLGAIAERTEAYAEWRCHGRESLAFLEGWREDRQELERGELQVALEELYWATQDPVYARLCEVLANACWCPRSELEADIFAHRYCDLIDATYGVLATGLACLPLYRTAESSGISALLPQLQGYPALVLRLQSLWMSASEEVQKNLLA